jgi:hypothetical protein
MGGGKRFLGPTDTDHGIGSSVDHPEGSAKNVLFTVWFLQNCADLVYFFVLFERVSRRRHRSGAPVVDSIGRQKLARRRTDASAFGA